MAIKKFGIYLAFPPTVYMRGQGLARYIEMLLKEAASIKEAQLVIACPGWLFPWVNSILDQSDQLDFQYEIITNFIWLNKFLGKRNLKNATHDIKSKKYKLLLVVFPIYLIKKLIKFLYKPLKTFGRAVKNFLLKNHFLFLIKIAKSIFKCKNIFIAMLTFCQKKFYHALVDYILADLIKKINQRKDIHAWYCPLVFWESFSHIKKPKLLCVPDIVFEHFPVGFALLDPNLQKTHQYILSIIRKCKFFMTYSNTIKYDTLVVHHGINPEHIFPIYHGASTINQLIFKSEKINNKKETKEFCLNLFKEALSKTVYQTVLTHINPEKRFIFYASQARPNKNILTLIKAYCHLRKNPSFHYKLILTCHPDHNSELWQYVKKNQLTTDVLFLYGLTEEELAVCYYLADLAVNPSLSEGGFPFTFTEALSVNTPVIMADISVTREILTDPYIQKLMLFDPYDINAIADKIQWGIANKELLLEKQLPIFQELSKRTWKDTAYDIFSVLEKISETEKQRAI